VTEKTRFVGRAAEIAHLEAGWRRVAAGQLSCVLLSGDRGVGKTRLAEEILIRHAGTATTLSARARPLGGVASFGLWTEALEQHLRALPREEVSALCGGLLDDLAGLLRSVAAVRGAVPSQEPPRIRLLESLGMLLANLARRRPVVVVLDDIHQADASSWDVLEYLALHFPRTAVLMVATAHPGELADQPLAVRILLDLEQRDVLQRLDVGPLTEGAVRELAEDVLGRVVTKDVVEWVVERSRGNPLYAGGLLRALRDEGGVPRPGLRLLPEELTDRVRVRVALLDDDAQRVLQVLAVAGGPVTLGDLVRFSGRPLDELAPIVRRLTHTRLVVEDERLHRVAYEISHPVVQETIYEDIGAALRFALHRQVGRALLIVGHLGEAALHFARSADRGDDEAIEVLQEALHQAEERGGYREALRFAERCAGDRRAWAIEGSGHYGAGFAGFLAGRGETALREIDALMDGAVEPGIRATVKSRLTSFLSWGTGELDEAAEAAEAAIDLYVAAGLPTEARLAALELAYARGLRGDLAALEAGAERVLSDAEAAGDDRATLQALGVLGTARFYQGNFVGAEAAMRRSIAMARSAGKLYRLTWGLMSLGWSLGFEGRFQEALAAFEEAKAAPAWRDSNVLELESHVRWLAGDFEGSLACAREAVALNPGGLSLRRAMGLCCAALSAIETDQLADARRDVSAARRVYGDQRWFFASDFSHQASGMLAWREGRLPEALNALRTAAEGLMAMGAAAFAGPILLDLAEVAVEAGEPRVAEEASVRLDGIARSTGRNFHLAQAALARAWSAVAHGRAAEGEEAALAAAELLPAGAYGTLRARALVARARSLEASGNSAALDILAEAAALFDASGAVWRRERALEALRSSGAAGRRAADAAIGASGLTTREREVARLAAERLTAQEIADRLFISRRTVETHLARVYAKLGVASKGELVHRLAEIAV